MNRYLVRAFVAILTFAIGVTVGSIFSTPSANYRHPRHRRCRESAPDQRVTRIRDEYQAPAVAVDNASTDPLKVRYERTRTNPTAFGRQSVEFRVEPATNREIARFTITYRSRGRSTENDGGSISIANPSRIISSGVPTFENVSIDSGNDEMLWVRVASVDFKDGSRWTNPRPPFN